MEFTKLCIKNSFIFRLLTHLSCTIINIIFAEICQEENRTQHVEFQKDIGAIEFLFQIRIYLSKNANFSLYLKWK